METLHKNIFKQPFFWTSVCSLLAVGIIVGLYSYAWVAPTAAPNSNAGAAINFYNSNVGIGTSTPSDKLHLYGTNVAVKVEATSNTAGLQLKSSTSDWFAYTFGTKFGIKNVTNAIWPFTIEATAPTNSFAIDSAGQVGIGTGVPVAKLHILADNTAGGSDRSNQLVIQGSTNTNYKLNMGIYTGTSPAYADIGFVEDGVAWRNIILARSGGNVGIGIASPGQKLSVAGVIESTTGGIKFPDGTSQTTAATAGGTMSWPTSVKETTATHNGLFATSPANGYLAIETWIQSNGCSGYHVCMPWELTYAFGHLSDANLCNDGTCLGRYNGGIYTEAGSASYNSTDCVGWTSNDSNGWLRSPYWSGKAPTSLTQCSGLVSVLCCK